jgi:GTP-binding protein
LVFFQLDDKRRLVDLPGYGFAKVPLAVKQRWQQTLAHYLHHRRSLKGLVLLMDIRHPLTPFDQQMLTWCQQAPMPIHILLTKADKLSNGKSKQTLQQVENNLKKSSAGITIQLFSALKRLGIEAVHERLNDWLAI